MTLASFYSTSEAETHGTSWCAFYMGRNSIDYGLPVDGRNAFKSDEDYRRYLDGRRSAAAEDRLDADTEWNADLEGDE